MAKVLLVCLRNPNIKRFSRGDLENLSNRLTPDNISFSPPGIISGNGIILSIFNPSDCVLIRNNSVCLGNFLEHDKEWWIPGREPPDGSYALFRNDKKCVEIVSDVVASRTIWYFMNDDAFIASTSQRAIIFCLRSFQFNKSVIPWMLSTGTLGPDLSWDDRLKCLMADSSAILDRSSWRLTVKINKCNFIPSRKSLDEYETILIKALSDTFNAIRLDYSKWKLPLSGGYDSRAILCMLKDADNVKCITWGLKSSLFSRKNDAWVARALACHFNLQHEYFETDVSDEPIEDIFNRFLICGEGRIDHISGYMDGFRIWKRLFETGVCGIIRGDEGFGWSAVATPFDVRNSIGLLFLSDYPNLGDIQEWGTDKQVLPDYLTRRKHEPLDTWRDRLYHQFRIPVILAALSDLKCPYVEIVNPLLSKKIIYPVREMPDNLRTDKKLFRKIVAALSPEVGFARYSAIADPGDILKNSRSVDVMRKELYSDYAKHVLTRNFIDYVMRRVVVINEYKAKKQKKKLPTDIARKFIPSAIKGRLRRTVMKEKMDFNILAFRAYIICKMYKILDGDAKASG
jgi:hypothetical protein